MAPAHRKSKYRKVVVFVTARRLFDHMVTSPGRCLSWLLAPNIFTSKGPNISGDNILCKKKEKGRKKKSLLLKYELQILSRRLQKTLLECMKKKVSALM
ncbi:hypothetical protein CEXT_375411 [Caerostris extrusa]|uniref:Uncharacterized protein n=1 Tax=Caerostris extrusa TaxID=172846 RepID=A0AAV4XGG8_CAEEX|nr:hypothetical protein CEXT_375411 [Caerostris extrusa]